MQRKIYVLREGKAVLTAFSEDGAIAEIRVDVPGEHPAIGSLVIGRIAEIRQEYHAAFLEIAPGIRGFCKLADLSGALFTTRRKPDAVTPGDEVLVQIIRESHDGKLPAVTGKLSIAGATLVIAPGQGVGFSRNISEEEREDLLGALIDGGADRDAFSYIVRTNAPAAGAEEVRKEAAALTQLMDEILDKAPLRTCFSVLYQPGQPYLQTIRDARKEGLSEIVTDDRELHSEIGAYLEQIMPACKVPLRLYKDEAMQLKKVIRLDAVLREIKKKVVWLPCGGNLVIERTEAMSVIDVNSGKAFESSPLRKEDLIRRVNMEAAKEIAKQLRLRNLSGIAVIDFINMASKEELAGVTAYLGSLLKEDPVKSTVVDITELQLVEVTRQRIRRPIEELLNEIINYP